MTDWILKDAMMMREEPVYADLDHGVLTCRMCHQKFKYKRNKRRAGTPSPCCPSCTLSVASRLAERIIEDAELAKIAASEAVPVLDPNPSLSTWRNGKRYIPLVPVVNTDQWQIARGLGYKGSVIELLFTDPKAAQDHADKFMRGKGPGRVLEIELVDAAHTTATVQERYERAERMIFKYTEEEQRLRPMLRGGALGESVKPEFQERDTLALANQWFAGPHLVMAGEAATHHCRRCDHDSVGISPFCQACIKVVLHEFATFVVEHSPDSAGEAG